MPSPSHDAAVVREEQQAAGFQRKVDQRRVDLGFAMPLEGTADSTARMPLEEADPEKWDGGKIGGHPIWMCRSAAPPSAELLRCGLCGGAMSLLVQLYAPLESEDVGHSSAYYRCLYVFCCRDGACVNRVHAGGVTKPSIRVLRSQYSRDSVAVGVGHGNDATPPICAVCGLLGPLRCSRCKSVFYCGRAHQTAHWNAAHKVSCGRDSAPAASAAVTVPGTVFPEFELVVEEEPSAAERREHALSSLKGTAAAAARESFAATQAAAAAAENGGAAPLTSSATTAAVSGAVGSGDDEAAEASLTLDDVTRKSLAEATGARLFSDAYMRYFQQRVACEPDQVIRYRLWPPAPPPPSTTTTTTVADEGGADAMGGDDSDLDDDDEEDEGETGSETSDDGGGSVQRNVASSGLGAAAPDAVTGPGRSSKHCHCFNDMLGAPLWVSKSNQPSHSTSPVPSHARNIAAAAAAATATDAASSSLEPIESTSSAAVAERIETSLTSTAADRTAENTQRNDQSAIPQCSACGAPRAFEFQIMPQILWCLSGMAHGISGSGGVTGGALSAPSRTGHSSSTSKPVEDLDFGTIAVYTCTRSCGGSTNTAATPLIDTAAPVASLPPGFFEEVAWVQPAEVESASIASLAQATLGGGGGGHLSKA